MSWEVLHRAHDLIVGSDFSDPTNERLIYLASGGLAVVGILLLIGTIVWWRRGRQEHPALAPLEVMGARSWMKASESDRRRRLEQVRTAGASGAVSTRVVAEPVDLRAMVRSMPAAFDDLREPAEAVPPPIEEPVVPEEVVAPEMAIEDPVEVEIEPHTEDAESDQGSDDTTIAAVPLPSTSGLLPEAAPGGNDEGPQPVNDEVEPEHDDEVGPLEPIASGPNEQPL